MSDIFDGFVYDKKLTVSSPVVVSGALQDYAVLVRREGGKTQVKNVSVIDIDFIKDSLKITPTPSSMDIAFIASKTSAYKNDSKPGIARQMQKYFFADFKFNVSSPGKVTSNISNDSIKAKFKFSSDYVRSKDTKIAYSDIAYFVFNDKNFEQVRNRWSQRNLLSPKNRAVRQSDFEKLFDLGQ